MSYVKFYDHYLSQHQNRHCRRLHLLGMAVGVVVAICLACFLNWWLVLLSPLAVYPFAWTGHLFFEKNTPATWTNPLFSALADLQMTWDICRGRIAF